MITAAAQHTEGLLPPLKNVLLLLYFDEAHTLLEPMMKWDSSSKRLAYHAVCKALSSITKQDAFVVYLSTDPRLSDCSPFGGEILSPYFFQHSNRKVGPQRLQAPFVELPFDLFAYVVEDEVKLADVAQLGHLAQFGRPLYVTSSPTECVL